MNLRYFGIIACVGLMIIVGSMLFNSLALGVENPYGGYNDKNGGWPDDVVTINDDSGIALCSVSVGDGTPASQWKKYDCSVAGGKNNWVKIVD